MTFNPLYYIIAFLVALLVGFGIFYKFQISRYEATVKQLKTDLQSSRASVVVSQANITTLKATIKVNNSRIEALRVVHADKLRELDEWKQRPHKVRYEYIYKYIKKDAKSEKCEDIKSTLNSLSTIDFNRL